MIGVGDLVVCIESGRRTLKGCLYTVSHIQMPGETSFGTINNLNHPCLRFHELAPWDHGLWSGAERFRKIDKREPCEIEFVELLNRSKRRVAC